MSIYRLKTAFQNQLRPISDALYKQGFSANQVTLSAVVLSLIIAHLIAHHAHHQRKYWLLLPSGLFVRMALNAIDGMMAKEHGQATTLGAWLNETGDVLSDTALLLSLWPHTKHHGHLTSITILSLTTEFIAIAATLLTGERANHGPMGKSDRAVALGLLGLMVGLGKKPKNERALLILFEILLTKTIINRTKHTLNHHSNKTWAN